MSDLRAIGQRAVTVKKELAKASANEKNKALLRIAEGLLADTEVILSENERDMEVARENHMAEGLLDRLQLTPSRIEAMAEGLRQIASLEDPIGEVLCEKVRPNGLRIGKKRVPIGVIGIIYEARPNVTADAFGLCFKTGNAVILKGGSDALRSNVAIVASIQRSLAASGMPEDAVLLITDTNRAVTQEFMRMNDVLDLLIPRGGAGLIRTVVENATVPVIETGTGNCHIYVEDSATIAMAVDIIENAKTQRIGVCNACESLVIASSIAPKALPLIKKRLDQHGVEMRGDEASRRICPDILPATEEDFGTEYLDYIISVKIVDSTEEAIEHINRYNTGHSESIITNDYNSAQQFLDEVDAACVYVNASTRFTDGFEFGFGAEIGISTQKLHARGPMGLEALTSTKYIIYGQGQIRS